MTEILFVYERQMPTVLLLKEKYGKLSKARVRFLQIKKVTNVIIEHVDIIVLIRPSDPLSKDIAAKAKKSGAFVIFYTDDDLLGLPKTSPFSKLRKEYLKSIASISDMVLAANPFICKKYSLFTMSKRYAETITSVEYLDLKSIEHKLAHVDENVKIVYAAGNGHEKEFVDNIKPILKNLDEKYGERVSFDFVGVHPEIDINSLRLKIHYINGMNLETYRKFMSDNQYDIGVAPLENSHFNRCKHYNKYLEYTASGIVGVYSNCEPYTRAIKDKYNGVLVNNKPENWYNAICSLIDNPETRKTYLLNAKNQILNDFSKKAFENKLYNDIPEFMEYCKKRTKCSLLLVSKYKYFIFLIIDKVYLLLFYFKHNKKYLFNKFLSITKMLVKDN